MTQKKTNPFLPYVSLREMLAFDPSRPETHTASPLVNAVLAAMLEVFPINGLAVAEYLQLSYADMRGGLKCATGMTFQEILREWTIRRLWTVLNENPDLSTDEIARKAGISGRAQLWKFLHKNRLVRETSNANYEPRNNILSIWRADKVPTE